MSIKVAKIVSSNSHVDYVGRVIDVLDADDPPASVDYGFGQFVALPVTEQLQVVGIIYNSQLINPDYGHFGPRLSPPADLALLSPDYLNERGILVGILLVGWREEDGRSVMSVPQRVIPVGQDVCRMDETSVRDFHQDAAGRVQLHYYSQVMAHAGPFAMPLIETIIAQLERDCGAEDCQRLCVLKRSLAWQRTFGGARL
ncbi:MAG: hypothetical protein WKF30_12130 [Pyrinomonadaceae bacterium]